MTYRSIPLSRKPVWVPPKPDRDVPSLLNLIGIPPGKRSGRAVPPKTVRDLGLEPSAIGLQPSVSGLKVLDPAKNAGPAAFGGLRKPSAKREGMLFSILQAERKLVLAAFRSIEGLGKQTDSDLPLSFPT